MTMMCVQCYLDGRRVPVGMRVDKNPPFAFMVYDGKSLCTEHLPAPAVVETEPPMFVPDEFGPLSVVREPVQTDNRFVVEEGTAPKPAKKTPAKRAPRKRTKS